MRDFQFFVTDDRYGVPSLMLVQTKDEATARVLAERLLAQRHHQAVEVRDGDRHLFSVGATSLDVCVTDASHHKAFPR